MIREGPNYTGAAFRCIPVEVKSIIGTEALLGWMRGSCRPSQDEGYIIGMPIDGKPIKGRGAATHVANRFLRHSYGVVHWEGIDEVEEEDKRTRYVIETAKSICLLYTSRCV